MGGGTGTGVGVVYKKIKNAKEVIIFERDMEDPLSVYGAFIMGDNNKPIYIEENVPHLLGKKAADCVGSINDATFEIRRNDIPYQTQNPKIERPVDMFIYGFNNL